MRKVKLLILSLCIGFLLVSCATTSTKAAAFPGMYEEKPTVMLIMPPINNSNYVDAKDYFYTTMNVPLAESGYYVLPPAATLATMQRESAYDSERFIDGDLKRFGKIFGADVAVFTIINKWEKSVIGSQVTIEIEYVFKSTKTNEVLYRRKATLYCDTSSNVRTNGLFSGLINLVADAVKTAVTDYVSVAIMCNQESLTDVPYGKYHPKYELDAEESAYPVEMYYSGSK